jgi:hypothetical protein
MWPNFQKPIRSNGGIHDSNMTISLHRTWNCRLWIFFDYVFDFLYHYSTHRLCSLSQKETGSKPQHQIQPWIRASWNIISYEVCAKYSWVHQLLVSDECWFIHCWVRSWRCNSNVNWLTLQLMVIKPTWRSQVTNVPNFHKNIILICWMKPSSVV